MKKNRFFTVIIFFFAAVSVLSGQEKRDALQLFRSRQFAEAVEVCLAELQDEPRNMDAYTVLGWSLVALERYQEAIEYGERALGVARFDHRIIYILGESYYRLNKNVEALNYLEEYVSLVPEGDNIDEVYYFMGEIFMRLNEYHHADIAFTTAVYHEPNISAWWLRLGNAREETGDLEYSLQAYERALDLNPRLDEAREGRDRVQARLRT